MSFYFIMLSVLKQNAVLLSDFTIYARWNYDKNIFTWYDWALCFYSEFVYAECYYAEYRYVEGHYAVFWLHFACLVYDLNAVP